MTAYIGVDPGLSGALSIIYPTGEIKSLPTPVAGKEIDVNAIVKWIDNVLPVDLVVGRYPAVAYIEKVWNISKGGIAIAKLNKSAGIIIGMFTAFGIPIYEVAPATWKKQILKNYRAKKEDSITFCQLNFPNTSLFRTPKSTKPDHNLADAICIAEYGRRTHK